MGQDGLQNAKQKTHSIEDETIDYRQRAGPTNEQTIEWNAEKERTTTSTREKSTATAACLRTSKYVD